MGPLPAVIPGRAKREPGIHSSIRLVARWIPGQREDACPGMTTSKFRHTANFRCRTGAPDVRLSAASMMALASMP
jgi:hypothetical protein